VPRVQLRVFGRGICPSGMLRSGRGFFALVQGRRAQRGQRPTGREMLDRILWQAAESFVCGRLLT